MCRRGLSDAELERLLYEDDSGSDIDDDVDRDPSVIITRSEASESEDNVEDVSEESENEIENQADSNKQADSSSTTYMSKSGK